MVAQVTRLHNQPASPAGILRLLAGWLIALLGAGALLGELLSALQAAAPLSGQSLPGTAIAGGGMAALATALGALPVLVLNRISARTQSSLLGFSAGVMLAACMFSLLLPAIEVAQAQGMSTTAALSASALALVAGAAALLALDRSLPHDHHPQGGASNSAVWLFVFAIAVHNIPEGLAIGVAAALDDGGRAVATGISLQNVPEGLVIAIALFSAGYKRWFAFAIAALSGVIEPVAALFASLAVATAHDILPWGLAAAAGAMLFVVSHEIIPESHRRGHETLASAGLIGGFVLMMMLDQLLG